MPRPNLPRFPWAGLLIIVLWLPSPAEATAGESVVVEEVLIVSGALLAADSHSANTNPASGSARFVDAPTIARTDAKGQRYFRRRTTEAFVDPDQPQNLEAKYHFELAADESPPAASAVSLATRLVAAPDAELAELADRLPLPLASPDTGVEWAWLDYATRSPKILVLLLPPGESAPAALVVCRVASGQGERQVERLLAFRELPDLGPGVSHAVRKLAVWDRPASLGPKGMLLGRVVALLTKPCERFAVDLFGERLHPDSDCRLWLTSATHRWGPPQGLYLASIPLVRESGRKTLLGVLAVDYATPDGARRVGLELPMCITPALEQMRQAANQAGRTGRGTSASEAAKLLGEELVEEIESRLVNAKAR